MQGLALLVAIAMAPSDEVIAQRVMASGLASLGAFSMLSELVEVAPHRLSGSRGAERAVDWVEAKMKQIGLSNIRRQPVKVPHWERGTIERAEMDGQNLAIAALGNSSATPPGGLTSEVVRVLSLTDLEKLGSQARGKIVFFDRPFDRKFPSTGSAYGAAVDQRTRGPQLASKLGAVACLVRSMTHATDDVPHTGNTNFGEQQAIPAAALGIQSADRLARILRFDPDAKVTLELQCKTHADADSSNVIGEIPGSDRPKEVIVVGGHLDGWDKGQGAHDDGAGVCQSLEAAKLILELGLKPRRTIRIVAFMNEENGLRGGLAYADWAKRSGERSFAAMESDSGGFMPREFNMSKKGHSRARKWLPLLRPFGIERIVEGGGGADVGPLGSLGTILVGLEPDDQRYFDYHHSDNDTIDKVHPRELQFGAMAMTMMAYLLAQS